MFVVLTVNGLLYIDLERVIPEAKTAPYRNQLIPKAAARPDISMLAVREHMRIFGFAGTYSLLRRRNDYA